MIKNDPAPPPCSTRWNVAIEYAPGGQPSTRQACTIRSFGTSSNWRPPMCPPKSANAPPTSLLIWVGVLSRGMDFIASLRCMILSNCLAPIYLAFETVFLAMVSVLERSLNPNGSSRAELESERLESPCYCPGHRCSVYRRHDRGSHRGRPYPCGRTADGLHDGCARAWRLGRKKPVEGSPRQAKQTTPDGSDPLEQTRSAKREQRLTRRRQSPYGSVIVRVRCLCGFRRARPVLYTRCTPRYSPACGAPSRKHLRQRQALHSVTQRDASSLRNPITTHAAVRSGCTSGRRRQGRSHAVPSSRRPGGSATDHSRDAKTYGPGDRSSAITEGEGREEA
jgi:hypothetical protein